MAKFHREDDERDEPPRRDRGGAGGGFLLVVLIVVGGLVLVSCAGVGVAFWLLGSSHDVASQPVIEVREVEAEDAVTPPPAGPAADRQPGGTAPASGK